MWNENFLNELNRLMFMLIIQKLENRGNDEELNSLIRIVVLRETVLDLIR